MNAYNQFASTENVDISLVMTGGYGESVAEKVIDIVSARRDAVGFISPNYANVTATDPVASVVNYREALPSTSYAVMDSNWKYMYDKYNDTYRWVPCNGDVAGLCARTDQERDPWFSPAGFNRGQLKNVIKLAYNPSQANRDELYKKGVNPIVSFPGEGVVLYGDKTLLTKPSAFDRINVRRLFIVLEKAIARAAKASLFELNDEFTRATFVNLVEPFLRTVQGRRGIYDFRVICDETNNTPEVIDRNEFIGDIYIKPARSINFIQLNFVAVRTGVAFDEIVGRF
jgi:phage tail sheath protein FI